ncbi:NUDIX domain-containing protein [bacterium]|nr:MAG: NUDIX domain-containing protein [bacterium]
MASVVSRIVEVCIFRFAGNSVEYLLLKRGKEDLLYPGIWQWVTGTILEGERSLDAALREFHEETGLAANRLWIVPHVTMFYESVHDSVHLSPLFAVQVEHGADPVLSPEHQEFRWVPYAEARRRLVWPGQREGLDMVHAFIVT